MLSALETIISVNICFLPGASEVLSHLNERTKTPMLSTDHIDNVLRCQASAPVFHGIQNSLQIMICAEDLMCIFCFQVKYMLFNPPGPPDLILITLRFSQLLDVPVKVRF